MGWLCSSAPKTRSLTREAAATTRNPAALQDLLEAFQQQKVWPDERCGEGSSERAIIARRGNGSVGIALRVILSQISSSLGGILSDLQMTQEPFTPAGLPKTYSGRVLAFSRALPAQYDPR